MNYEASAVRPSKTSELRPIDPAGPAIEIENVSLVFPLYSVARLNQAQNSEDVQPPTYDTSKLITQDGRILGVRALQRISLSIGAGERVALIGLNGAGKTTLLQVMAGILAPDQGRVVIHGRATNLINIHLGLLTQATGYRNIVLRGLAAGRTRQEIDARRNEIAEFSELGEFLNMPVSTYSAGMRMRLNFAIATAFEPEILILDEWISAGDRKFRANAARRMQEFVDRAGIVVLASHSNELLLNNCERGVWLDNGQVEMDGPIKEVIEAYKDKSGAAEAD